MMKETFSPLTKGERTNSIDILQVDKHHRKQKVSASKLSSCSKCSTQNKSLLLHEPSQIYYCIDCIREITNVLDSDDLTCINILNNIGAFEMLNVLRDKQTTSYKVTIYCTATYYSGKHNFKIQATLTKSMIEIKGKKIGSYQPQEILKLLLQELPARPIPAGLVNLSMYINNELPDNIDFKWKSIVRPDMVDPMLWDGTFYFVPGIIPGEEEEIQKNINTLINICIKKTANIDPSLKYTSLPFCTSKTDTDTDTDIKSSNLNWVLSSTPPLNTPPSHSKESPISSRTEWPTELSSSTDIDDKIIFYNNIIKDLENELYGLIPKIQIEKLHELIIDAKAKRQNLLKLVDKEVQISFYTNAIKNYEYDLYGLMPPSQIKTIQDLITDIKAKINIIEEKHQPLFADVRRSLPF